MPEEPSGERPVFSWGTKRHSNTIPGSAFGAGGRPLFGVGRFRWVVIAAVVSALAAVFIFLGAGVGLAIGRSFGRRTGLVVMLVVTSIGGIGGVVVGTRVALRLTDVERTRAHLVGSAVGGVLGLVLGSVIPALQGLATARIAPLIAIGGAGIGAVAGLMVPMRSKMLRAKGVARPQKR